jgi:hypothetical protein
MLVDLLSEALRIEREELKSVVFSCQQKKNWKRCARIRWKRPQRQCNLDVTFVRVLWKENT